MRTILVVLLLCLAASLARAGEPPVDAPWQAAQKAEKASAGGDTAQLEKLARRDQPDPWLVADYLIGRRAYGAAKAFAAAGKRKDTEALEAYVDGFGKGEAKDDAGLRRALEEVERAYYDRERERGWALLERLDPKKQDALAVRVHAMRARALAAAGDALEAGRTYVAAAKIAGSIGWLAQAALCYELGASSLARADQAAEALGAANRWLATERARERPQDVARAHVSIGWGMCQAGLTEAGLAEMEKGVAIHAGGTDVRAHAEALASLARQRSSFGDKKKALEELRRARALFRGLEDVAAEGATAKDVAWTLFDLGQQKEALKAAEEALALCTRANAVAAMAECHNVLGAIKEEAGQDTTYAEHFRRALSLYEQAGDQAGIMTARGNVLRALWSRQELRKCEPILEELRAFWTERRDLPRLAETLSSLAGVQQGLGRYAEAYAMHTAAVKAAREGGNKGVIARTLERAATSRRDRGELADAEAMLGEAGRIAQEIGEAKVHVAVLTALIFFKAERGDLRGALRTAQEARALAEASELRGLLVLTMGGVAWAYDKMGRFDEALALAAETLALTDEIGRASRVSTMYLEYLLWVTRAGRFRDAFDTIERVRALVGDNAQVRLKLAMREALVYQAAGDLVRSHRMLVKALDATDPVEQPASHAQLLLQEAQTLLAMGDFGAALSRLDRVTRMREGFGDKLGAAEARLHLADALERSGDPEGALAAAEAPLAWAEECGFALLHTEFLAVRARALGDLGRVPEALGALEEALAVTRRADAASQSLAHAVAVSELQRRAGKVPAALRTAEEAVAGARKLGLRRELAEALRQVGRAHTAAGRTEEAHKAFQESVRQAERMRSADVLVHALADTARLQLRNGKAELALATAHRATPYLERMFRGQSREQGAMVRAEFAAIAELGVLAASKLEDDSEVVHFLEQGRAGRLLESLSRGDGSEDAEIPPELRNEERLARLAEVEALAAWSRALDERKLKPLRARKRELDAARVRRQKAIERIRQANRMRSMLYYPRVADLTDLQGALREDEALVLYGMLSGDDVDDALAAVVTPRGMRVVRLGKASDLDARVAALATSDAAQDPSAGLDALREALVAPLRLGAKVKRLLVSPSGSLAYAPFAALVPAREVALVPSGTVYTFLTDARRLRGSQVLAIGDPSYGTTAGSTAATDKHSTRGGKLAPLPQTRLEVEAIGNVKLLGKGATVPGFVETLAREERWRAVHLACHGIVDRRSPMLSALALTPSSKDDGYLSAIELARLQVPADLVVLSACDTGRGRIVKGEGILGLTRAFLYAGAPRVICSLWKVDDEATRALMVKFYELWNPKDGKQGLGAAAALKRAQAYVRDVKDESGKQKWKHPYYWAAWVLWGLPD